MRAEPSAQNGPDTLIYAIGVTAGSLASMLAIAAGSVIFYGLIVRAQPNSAGQANTGGPPKKLTKEYVKGSNNLLVMRASAK